MEWQHEVSGEWLEARRLYLTATDIVKLAPAAKKWKSGDPFPPTFIGLWMEKHSDKQLDCVSYGSAARGHCMEPFAVLDANRAYGKKFSHWDDVIIHNGYLGFSPDAMDMPQPVLPVDISYDDERIADVREIMEVKCFEPYHHGQCVYGGFEQAQLIQVGMAFKVLPNLEKATILFYCPGAFIDMAKFELTVGDVNNASCWGVIDKVAQIWEELTNWMWEQGEKKASYTEAEIHKIAMKEMM